MPNKTLKLLIPLAAAALLASCGLSSSSSSSQSGSKTTSAETSSTTSSSSSASSSAADSETSADEESETSIPVSYDVSGDSSAFSIVRDADGLVPEESNGVYQIVEGGSYTCSGTLVGMLYINVPETEDGSGEVELNLAGVDMSYSGNSVIYCLSADKLEISAKKDTENVITDLRALQTEDDATQGGGVIYSKVDTKLKGTGSLSVTGTYNNGIHVTKDLTIQKLTLTSKAINNAIKGNDSLTINSGDVTAISVGGDGLKTADSDVSSKGNQRGDIQIAGGKVTVYSACDGIQAAHDVIIGDAEDATAAPEISIKTNKYSSYTDESAIQESSSDTMYLRTSGSTNYRFSVYFYNEVGGEGVWAKATKVSSSNQGGFGGRSYSYYSLSRPSSYSSFAIYAFDASDATDSLTSYKAKSSGSTINSSYDTVSFSLSGSTISLGQWSNYSSTQGGQGGPGGGWGPGGSEGNADKADVSAKGVKSANNIYVYGGSMDVTAYDDGLHACYGEALESGETSTGDLYVYGGTITVSASDDGLHADRYLDISGGEIHVSKAYEGLEANQIKISGGKSVVYASDDALNANAGTDAARLSALITVNDGYLFAAVPTNGDVDCIDSNGNYVQNGGTVIAAGPGNSGGAAALDTDGSVSVNGGSLILFGSSERTPSAGSGVTSSSKSGTYGGKAYNVTFAKGSVQTETLPSYSYSYCRCWSVLGSVSSVA